MAMQPALCCWIQPCLDGRDSNCSGCMLFMHFALPRRRRLLNVCRQSLGLRRFDQLLDNQRDSRLVVTDLAPQLRIAWLEFSEPLIPSPTLRRALGGGEQEALLPAEQPLHR